jgi:hypothetical protein
MRARVFVAVLVAGCATSPFPAEPVRYADRALTLRELRSDSTNGRFLVRTPEFLDPAIYAPGRRLTVDGVRSCMTTLLSYWVSGEPSRGETVRSKT